MTVHISIAMPSRELEKCEMDSAVTRLAEQVALQKRQGRVPQDHTLDISFLLSSEQEAPPFTGMRMGGYSEENDILYFQAAVPLSLTRSMKAPLYVSLVLQDVVDNASEFFSKNGITFDKVGWQDFFESISLMETGSVTKHIIN